MEAAGNGGRAEGSSSPKPLKFSAYQNPALSAALTVNSIQPSKFTFLCIFSLSSASAFAFLRVVSWENAIIDSLKVKNIPEEAAYVSAKAVQTVVGLVFLGTVLAFFKAIFLYRRRFSGGVSVVSASNGSKDQTPLSKRQLGLMGLKPKVENGTSEKALKPPKSKPYSSPPSSDVLVPLHQSMGSFGYSSQRNTDKSNSVGGSKMQSFTSPAKSPGSDSSFYLVSGVASPLPSALSSSGRDSVVCTSWSSKRVSSLKEITSEEEFERFLTEVDEKLTESAGKLATPPPTISSVGLTSPSTVDTSANTSGTTRSTPLRPVRMSPSSQKFKTPPKKGEGDPPSPMSMEEMVEAFKHLGVYPQIEEWRDRLRQWFSSILLNPLVEKIETSHVQVKEVAAKLGISITVSPVGDSSGTLPTVSSVDRTNEWQPTLAIDEDGLLHQLRATLVQSIDASKIKMPLVNIQRSPQQNPSVPIMQECVDAIVDHQKLLALMKGELVKGLLPQSSIRADYTVQRIKELSEGSCLKNYEYLVTGEVYDKKNKKWTLDLPTDSHLLLYLFCAFLEHPKWMLHLDPSTYAGAQSSKNPLFLGVLPPKERFPEKYIAIIYGAPSIIHPGACILAVGRKSPPVFSLYWDKKLQFSLQGRTALWDAILLLCHRVKVGYDGIIRGMHLGSSALRVHPVLNSEPVD
ncbi:transmembrane protein 209-like [Cucurbita moschata]|uniref:Transmembrane protein 209-like n=1 Tax=Cucurbita moschata TaxID=3662 RepID=A0A6J1GC80_CUCMO|nr:transmembrane protein 209-like [Cucurbita moschata]